MEPMIISAAIGATAGILTGLIAARAGRRKNDAEAAQKITEAATQLVIPLSNRIEALEKELEQIRPMIKKLLAGIERLIKQIRCLGHEPVWTPEHEAIPLEMKKNGRGK